MAHAEGFGEPQRWNDYFAIIDGVEVPTTGDFDGDGRADIIDFSRGTGAVYVSRSDGASFGAPEQWHSEFARGAHRPLVGNFDGVGGDDIIVFQDGPVLVALSDGSSFGSALRWHDELGRSTEVPRIGDVNGDGMDDVIIFVQDTWGWFGLNDVYVALSTGSSFEPAVQWHADFAPGGEVPEVGDFDGDGMDDIASFVRGAGSGAAYADVKVAISTGAAFGPTRVWNGYFGQSRELPLIADVDADGCDDILVAVRDTWGGPGKGNMYVAFADCAWGYAFLGTRLWHTGFGVTEHVPFGVTREDVVTTGDVDGDGLADLVSFVQAGFGGDERGDVQVALNAEDTPQAPDARAEDFGFGAMNVHGTPALGQRPLMAILIDFSDQRFRPHHTTSFYRTLLFGIEKSINGFFWENSVHQFAWRDAGIYGPFTHRDRSSTTMLDESRYACATGGLKVCRDAGINDRTMRAEAIALAAENGVDFAVYDTNFDGTVTEDELTIFVWLAEPPANQGASVRAIDCVQVPAARPGGYVSVCGKVPGASEGASFVDIAHELTHVLQGDRNLELYGSRCYSNEVSLMSCTGGPPEDRRDTFHLDGWHKMQLGWVRPRIFPMDAPGTCAMLRSVQTEGGTALDEKRPILLYDRRRGTGEYFMLENRDKRAVTGGTYDLDATTPGAVVWHVRQDADHRPIRVPSEIIAAGADKILQTTVPPGSDDQTFDGDDDGKLDRLEAGPDRIVQSVPAGDDVRLLEPYIWSVGPGTLPIDQARGLVDPWTASEGPFTLRWSDGGEAEVVLQVASAPEPGRFALRWAWHSFDVMRPFWRLTPEQQVCHGLFVHPASPIMTITRDFIVPLGSAEVLPRRYRPDERDLDHAPM
ncbi:MAG TPA: FG-GAP-like repeat-containing protein [Kofleriaceae bacterium]|nr:FG-GAP-like repeat-containing protein [Kofleriaceae bacterium]